MRRTPWRRGPSEAVSRHLEQAATSTMYIVREFGPTGFLLREAGEARPLRALLGDPHSCSCAAFLREREPCAHLCWLLLRRFRLPPDHEYCFQGGLGEREISGLLRGEQCPPPRPPLNPCPPAARCPGPPEGPKPLEVGDVCPICQEELLRRRLPVSRCQTCFNSVHLSCMKLWAEHQPQPEGGAPTLSCPLCREDFAPLPLLQEELRGCRQLVTAAERERPERHLGLPCNGCRTLPIEGPCYRCAQCSHYHLCQACHSRGLHPSHSFLCRQRRGQRWRAVQRLPGAPSDSAEPEGWLHSSHVPKHVLKTFPVTLVRQGSKLLDPGQQCRLCLMPYSPGQHARLLPCKHRFHRDCIDPWLLHEDDACPLDKQVMYNPLTWKDSSTNGNLNLTAPGTHNHRLGNPKDMDLFIPGTGLFCKKINHSHLGESPQVNGDTVFHEKHQMDPTHNWSASAIEGPCSKQYSSKHQADVEREASHSSKYLPETAQKPCSVSRRGVPKRIRGSSSACVYLVQANKRQDSVCPQINHGSLGRVAACQVRKNSKSAAAFGFHADLDLAVLLGTSDFKVKGDPEQVQQKRERSRLLARRPKQAPVTLQTPDMAFLMEGFPLNSYS